MKEKSPKNEVTSGISAKRLNFIMAGITLVISVILLFSTFRMSVGYKILRDTTEDYLVWQRSVNKMQYGSDYLTEQVRFYVEKGDLKYLDNYFKEAEETQSRDASLEEMKDIFSGTAAYYELNAAMKESVRLMDREYYAMRLKIEALGENVEKYPEKIQDVVLTENDAALSAKEKDQLAREMVFDDVYTEFKDHIMGHIANALDGIIDIMEEREDNAANILKNMIINEQILIIVLIIMVAVIVIVTTINIIVPLVKAVPHIKEEKPIPLSGAPEFRFLAHTYNQIFEANNAKKKQLSYAATHDYLTGLYNRSGCDKELKLADLETSALVIIDVDHFKTANDTFGHETGDVVLKKVAATIKDNFRSYDIVSRFGGDNLRFCSSTSAKIIRTCILRKMREINDILSTVADGSPAISVSAGVAFGKGKKPSVMFKQADAALYQTKENGRRGVTFYGDETKFA